MAGEHQGHHLVADLAVGEFLAAGTAGAGQEAEDVAPGRVRICPAAGDLAEDDLVEHLARAVHPAPGRARAAQQAEGEVDPVEAEGALEVLGRGGALAGLVGVEPEQGPHRDPHRQVAHPLVDVGDLADRQSRDRPVGLDRHRLGRGDDLLAVEGRHHDRAGAVVVVVVDRQQAVAEQRDQVAEARLAPVEVLRVGDGDEVVGLGPEHEDDPRVQQPHREDRPELIVGVEQQRQRVVGDLVGAGPAEVGRPGREPAPPPPLVGDVGDHPADRVAGHLRRPLDRVRGVDGCHDGNPNWLGSQFCVKLGNTNRCIDWYSHVPNKLDR